MSEQFPSTAQCTGFDISLDQSPSQKWLPNNVRMRQWDIFHPPPSELLGTFDVVHVRHLHLVVKDNDVVSIVKNLRALLSTLAWGTFHFWNVASSQDERNADFHGAETNGYLQWDEVDPEAKYIAKTDPAVSTRALENMFMKFSIPKSKGGASEYVFLCQYLTLLV